MKVRIIQASLGGRVCAVPSKSQAHRILICAAFAKNATRVFCPATNNDIEATAACLRALGAKIEYYNSEYLVTPVSAVPEKAQLDVGESGSTLRFLLPIVGALGVRCEIKMHGRLPERPLFPLDTELLRHGMKIEKHGDTLVCGGRLTSGEYTIDGGVSSQFVSGLLLAQMLLDGQSTLAVTGDVQSVDYIKMTLEAMRKFGADVNMTGNTYTVNGGKLLNSDGGVTVDGDWSSAAFWLCAGAISDKKITLSGMNTHSSQGDKRVCDVLERFGCKISTDTDGICCISADRLTATVIDGADIPDIIPVLSVVAAVSDGETVVRNAERLRLKESDRLAATANALTALGADIRVSDDGFIINGVKRLRGGQVDGALDHRIVMSAAVASIACDGEVEITDAEAVSKSYPDFWRDFEALGGKFEIIEN